MTLMPGANAADETIAPSHGYAGLAERGRALLRSGQLADAERLVRAGMESGPDDALLCLAGEIRFRRADFDGARRAFQSALDANPGNARAWWGIGRIEQLHFNRTAARDLFAKAFRLDPNDTDIVISFLNFVENVENRRILLRNVASIARVSMPERAAQAVAHLQIESHLAGRPADDLASAYTGYRLPLSGFHPSGATRHGLVVTARINGGRPLRLVLDTGARGILLHKSAASGLALESVADSKVGGFGGSGASDSSLMLARSVTFDDLAFRDCLVEVSAHNVTAGADGILGASLFERFRIRIDSRSRTLELTPGGGGMEGKPDCPPFAENAPSLAKAPVRARLGSEPRASASGCPRTDGEISREVRHGVQALGLDRLLLVRTSVAGSREGWFLLDTGAAFTAITPRLTSAAQARAGGVELAGIQGTAAAFRVAPIALQVGGRALAEPEAVALDLAAISQREGVEISGILGFSTLSRWPLTIDFRSGLVLIGDPR